MVTLTEAPPTSNGLGGMMKKRSWFAKFFESTGFGMFKDEGEPRVRTLSERIYHKKKREAQRLARRRQRGK